MRAGSDTFIADATLRMEAELRERLDRQLRLQPGAFDAADLFAAVTRQYERDLAAKVARAEKAGNEELADALDRMRSEILPDVVDNLRAAYHA
jgi:hypothetical protein